MALVDIGKRHPFAHSHKPFESDSSRSAVPNIVADVLDELNKTTEDIVEGIRKDITELKKEMKAIDDKINEQQRATIEHPQSSYEPLVQLTLAVNNMVVSMVLSDFIDPDDLYCIRKISQMIKAIDEHSDLFKSHKEREEAKLLWKNLQTQICCQEKHLVFFKKAYRKMKSNGINHYDFDLNDFVLTERVDGVNEEVEMLMDLREIYQKLKSQETVSYMVTIRKGNYCSTSVH